MLLVVLTVWNPPVSWMGCPVWNTKIEPSVQPPITPSRMLLSNESHRPRPIGRSYVPNVWMHMADVKLRQPYVEANISQGCKIETLVRVVCGKIGQTLAPGVVGRPIQAVGEALPELNLEAIVAVPAGVIHEVHAAGDVGIEQEEVDRIGTRRVSSAD